MEDSGRSRDIDVSVGRVSSWDIELCSPQYRQRLKGSSNDSGRIALRYTAEYRNKVLAGAWVFSWGLGIQRLQCGKSTEKPKISARNLFRRSSDGLYS